MNRTQTIRTYEDIDWHLLWLNARAGKSWKSKGAGDWDKKAGSFADRIKESPYISMFLSHLELDNTTSVLDVGCGPGTLALPIAEKTGRVTALDYSRKMLDLLDDGARKKGLTNIRSLQCAWEDDWQTFGVGVHDIAIASRSMNIENLGEGIKKLQAHARHRVFIADRISPSPFDPEAFQAIGREFNSGPDYIFTLNTLYRLGIHPTIAHIELAERLRFKDFGEAISSYRWMFKELTHKEEERLKHFVSERIIEDTGDSIVLQRRFPQRWALISWKIKDRGRK